MSPALGEAFRLLDAVPVPAVALVAARTIPMVTFNPLFGGGVVPGPVRMGFAGCLTMLLWPLVQESAPSIPSGPGLPWLIAREIALGAFIGLMASLMFHAYSTAGRLIDTQRGANLAETLAFLTREQTSFLGQFLFQLSVLTVIFTGGHRVFLRMFAESFRLIPPGEAAGTAGVVASSLADLSGGLLRMALLLAAPAILLVALVDLASGLISRMAPQMNTFQTMQPARLLVGLWGLSVSLPALMSLAPGQWSDWVLSIYSILQKLGQR